MARRSKGREKNTFLIVYPLVSTGLQCHTPQPRHFSLVCSCPAAVDWQEAMSPLCFPNCAGVATHVFRHLSWLLTFMVCSAPSQPRLPLGTPPLQTPCMYDSPDRVSSGQLKMLFVRFLSDTEGKHAPQCPALFTDQPSLQSPPSSGQPARSVPKPVLPSPPFIMAAPTWPSSVRKARTMAALDSWGTLYR